MKRRSVDYGCSFNIQICSTTNYITGFGYARDDYRI